MGLDARALRSMSSRTMLVNDLKRRVSAHEYVVDCGAVAEAFLARQARCSYPESARSPWASESTSPAGPSLTRPTTDVDGSPGGPQTSSS
jgi:hypothetical protein